MNWANRLTLSRLVLTILFVAALNSSWQYGRTAALILFLLAGITDFVDGEVARRYSRVTNFGKLMDPLVDKIMTISAFICLVSLGSVPAWAVIVIVSREFLITGLRLIAAMRGKVLPAERLGKWKTALQICTILYCLILVAVIDQYAGLLNPPALASLNAVGLTLIFLTVGLTLWSGISYFAKNWYLVGDL